MIYFYNSNTHDMEAKIVTSSNYGFGHKWHLQVNLAGVTKTFYLGQDVKVCSRMLGATPQDVIMQIGGRDVEDETISRNLAALIIDTLDITEEQIKELQPWEMACE